MPQHSGDCASLALAKIACRWHLDHGEGCRERSARAAAPRSTAPHSHEWSAEGRLQQAEGLRIGGSRYYDASSFLKFQLTLAQIIKKLRNSDAGLTQFTSK
jgi:hypothetical protein